MEGTLTPHLKRKRKLLKLDLKTGPFELSEINKLGLACLVQLKLVIEETNTHCNL